MKPLQEMNDWELWTAYTQMLVTLDLLDDEIAIRGMRKRAMVEWSRKIQKEQEDTTRRMKEEGITPEDIYETRLRWPWDET